MLSAPGMDVEVKVDLRINRKTALFLVNVIEKGLNKKGDPGYDLLSLSPVVSREELADIAKGILDKAGLAEMNGKLKAIALK